MVYLLQEIEPGSSWNQPQNEVVLQIMNFLMLIGLGAWLIFMAVRRNPHQNNFLRLELRHRNLIKKIEKSTTSLVSLESALPAVRLHRDASESSFSANLATATGELVKATKSTYRRALINEFGSKDFTSSYFKKP